MSTRNTEDPTRSGEFRYWSDFQIIQLLCIQRSSFLGSQTTSERPLNDIRISVRMTNGPQKPTDCVPSRWPDSNLFHTWVNFPSSTVKLFCHVSIWPRHGIVKKCCSLKKKTAERNFLYGYDVAESSSDVDATSSSSNSSESSAET